MIQTVTKANDENALPNLGHSELFGLHDEPMQVITPVQWGLYDLLHEFLEFRIQQTRNVLCNKHPWLNGQYRLNERRPHISFILSATLMTCYAEWLTRRTTIHQVDFALIP